MLVDEAGELLVGQEQQHVVDGRPVALAGVVALGQLLDPQPDVGEEALEVRLALGVGADLQVAQVRGQRELDVHVQHVALGQVEREVGPAGAAVDLGLLAVVDVLGEPGEAQHVLGHPLAPLAPGLRVGQRLAQHARRVGEGAGDLGVGAQRLVDLPEALGARRAELGDQRAEALQLGAHLDPDLVEAGVDDVLLRRQVGLHAGGHGAGRRAELLAVEHRRLLQRGPHGGVALGGRPATRSRPSPRRWPRRRRRRARSPPGRRPRRVAAARRRWRRRPRRPPPPPGRRRGSRTITTMPP